MTESRRRISREWIQGFTELYALLYFKSHPNSSGYDLSKHVRENYGCRISYSKIYPLLERLEGASVVAMREDAVDYPPKKLYRLTTKGRRMIEDYRKVFGEFLRG